MKPLPYVLSLMIATVGIAGLQVAMPDTLAVALLWASVVLSTFSAGWHTSAHEKRMTVITASVGAIYLLPGAPGQSGGADRLYVFKTVWFILPVWVLLMAFSFTRIRRFRAQKVGRSNATQAPLGSE